MIHFILIALKSITVYVFIIAAIRLFGKKELAQLTIIDLVFILLISNSVQNAMVGDDTSLPGGIIAALGLFICNFFFKTLMRKSESFSKLVQGEKIILVHDGVVLESAMKKAMMSLDELEQAIREHGVCSIKEVNLMILECDGNISVLSSDYSHKTSHEPVRRKKKQISHNP